MLQRNIKPRIEEALGDTPAIILCGARQTGKTTLVQSLPNRSYRPTYLTFDDSTLLSAAKEDPSGFIFGLNLPVILDEVQRVPEIFPVIKNVIDKKRQPGSFLLTGSANVLFLPDLSESLAGRVELFTLWPLSQQEMKNRAGDIISELFEGTIPKKVSSLNKAELFQRVLKGGYPEPLTRKGQRQRAWFSSYITTILQRDIRDLADIQGLTKLPRLLSLLASRSGSLLNLSAVSNAVDIPYATLHRYMALLEATFLIVQIPAWSSNLGLRLVKSPKLLINDTGMLASLLGLDGERFESDPNLVGSMLETFVGMELVKLISQSETDASLYHFRSASRHEVDFVIERPDGKIVGIEVKAAGSVVGHDLKGLKYLAEHVGNKLELGLVLYSGSEVVPFGNKMYAIPISFLWHA